MEINCALMFNKKIRTQKKPDFVNHLKLSIAKEDYIMPDIINMV
jgi:hypothetical protein